MKRNVKNAHTKKSLKKDKYLTHGYPWLCFGRSSIQQIIHPTIISYPTRHSKNYQTTTINPNHRCMFLHPVVCRSCCRCSCLLVVSGLTEAFRISYSRGDMYSNGGQKTFIPYKSLIQYMRLC